MNPIKRIFKRQTALMSREYSEYKTTFLMPLLAMIVITAAVTIFTMIKDHAQISQSYSENRILLGMFSSHSSLTHELLTKDFYLSNIILFFITWLIIGFYCVACLYNDRRDKSILFWQSLPISQCETVISKCLTAFLTLPGLMLIAAVINNFLSLIICSLGIMILSHGGFPSYLWSFSSLFAAWWHLITVFGCQILIAAPFIGWFLFCSAFFKKAPIVFAIIIPAAASIIDQVFFNGGIINLTLSKILQSFVKIANPDFNASFALTNLSFEFVTIGVVIGIAFAVTATFLRSKSFGQNI
jgi:ABC-2 type transport system permease protein